MIIGITLMPVAHSAVLPSLVAYDLQIGRGESGPLVLLTNGSGAVLQTMTSAGMAIRINVSNQQ
jgi:hypothetical protein